MNDFHRRDTIETNTSIVIIDTCFAYDVNLYETGIQINDNDWIIAGRYETAEHANIGHNAWIETVSKSDEEKE